MLHKMGAAAPLCEGAFEPLHGEGLFPVLGTVVHSCVPNCDVMYDGPASELGQALRATLYTVCSIAPGSELTLAYIDATLPWGQRQALLRYYGVECKCPKCTWQDWNIPLSSEALWEFGRVAESEDRYDDAVQVFERILEGSPEDGDAHLALGRAYLNTGAWGEGRAAYARGVELCPGHEGLLAQDAERRAYLWDLEGHPEGHPRLTQLAMAPAWRCWVSTVGQMGQVGLAQGVITPEECRGAVEMAEAHAAEFGGWSTQRHYAVPTTDLPVHQIGALLPWFNSIMKHKLVPMLARLYPRAVQRDKLRVHDAFLVKYDARAQRELPLHSDQSEFSFTISLNPLAEYEGGGTWFEDLDQTLRPDVGGVVAFPGHLCHSGAPITQGVRYIIAVFMYMEGEDVGS